jgi:hypothetical protein
MKTKHYKTRILLESEARRYSDIIEVIKALKISKVYFSRSAAMDCWKLIYES